jgi:hypothetical protein
MFAARITTAVYHATRRALPVALGIGSAALALYAYRGLPERPFAADDYQWLLNVRGLSLGQVARTAFDPGMQTHFYRPLVWLVFWAQAHVFGLDPRGYHAVSLALHLLNAGLLGALAMRLPIARPWQPSVLAAAIVALHPAPFEAVVWISAQSELLAAALLLAMLHVWLAPQDAGRGRQDDQHQRFVAVRRWSFVVRPAALLATFCLGLALLAKESAVIGLPLLVVLGSSVQPGSLPRDGRSRQADNPSPPSVTRFARYALPVLLTMAYIVVQVAVERRNYVWQSGGYGIGPQLVLNPLRSLALIVAPLPGTEHADASWLVPLGAIVALALLVLLVCGPWAARRLVLALLLTLLPTAPFASPPDSRYLYLPVLAAALLLATGIGWAWGRRSHPIPSPQSSAPLSVLHSPFSVLCSLLLVLTLAWAAAGELAAREGRFAAASGPGGSLWRVATALCSADPPRRVIVVDPPLAAPHAEAIVHLACGADVQPLVVGRDQLTSARAGQSVVIAFPNGSAVVERSARR